MYVLDLHDWLRHGNVLLSVWQQQNRSELSLDALGPQQFELYGVFLQHTGDHRWTGSVSTFANHCGDLHLKIHGHYTASVEDETPCQRHTIEHIELWLFQLAEFH